MSERAVYLLCMALMGLIMYWAYQREKKFLLAIGYSNSFLAFLGLLLCFFWPFTALAIVLARIIRLAKGEKK